MKLYWNLSRHEAKVFRSNSVSIIVSSEYTVIQNEISHIFKYKNLTHLISVTELCNLKAYKHLSQATKAE